MEHELLKTCTNCRENKPLSLFYLMPRGKFGVEPTCKSCKSAYHKQHYLRNKVAICERTNLYSKANREKANDYSRNWNSSHTEKIREYGRRYASKHPGAISAKAARRRACRLQATPPWADLEAIKQIYVLCEKISKWTGIKHHVDHIIPLKGKRVSGLHVHTNLRIIQAIDNIKKSNKLIEEIL